MKVVLNYSYPLGDLEKEQIREKIGDFEEVITPVDIDEDKPITPQIASIYFKGANKVKKLGFEFDHDNAFLIPPNFPAAAYCFGYLNGISNGKFNVPLRFIWFKKVGTYPQLILGGIEW